MRMKRLFFLSCFVFSTSMASAQWINSFTIQPSNPTINDSITVIVECMFPSGSCDGTATLTGIAGDQVIVDAYHCVGMLTVICTDYDTIHIPPLAQGSYNLHFTLVTGDGFPCAPGSLPVVTDSVTIDVSGAQSAPEIPHAGIFTISPNPSKGRFTLTRETAEEATMRIMDLNGRLVKDIKISGRENEFEFSLPAGIYSVVVQSASEKYVSRLKVTGQ